MDKPRSLAVSLVMFGALLSMVGASWVYAQTGVGEITQAPTGTPPTTTPLMAPQVTEEPRVLSEEEAATAALFAKRPATELTVFNGVAFFVQRAVAEGVRPNTGILILLLPFLATVFAFAKHIVGFPTLEMLVPIALSVSLLATGLVAGLSLLGIMVAATFLSRFLLRRLRIMQVPKRSLALLIAAVSVFVALLVGVLMGLGDRMTGLSIFPILMFLILSDRISEVQLQSSMRDLFIVGSGTIVLGILGYLALDSVVLRNIVLLYPETVLLLIPINVLIGRYFGLRLSEYFRFAQLRRGKSGV